jgi:hypothetical protein
MSNRLSPVTEIIAERRLFAVSAKSEKLTLRITVGRPYQLNDVSWACPVSIEGLYAKLHDAVGIDSWQALNLAIGLTRQLLDHFLEGGGKLYWEEGGDEVILNDLIPQLKGS